jgi:hypothetical protein
LVGPDVLHRMLPVGALAALKLVAEAGLVPYLVGVAHKLELGAAGLQRRALGGSRSAGSSRRCVSARPSAAGCCAAGRGLGGPRRHRPSAARAAIATLEWVVTIRSAEIRDRTLRMFAGAGVVAGSDPEVELAETGAKLRTMLHALGTTDAL